MTPNSLTHKAYSSIVAGTLPVDKSDASSAVNYSLLELLGTESIHVIISFDENLGCAHFIGLPSANLGGVVDLSFPLSCALPGHPDFKGDGCYVEEGAPISAVIEVRNGLISYICNETNLIDSYVSDSDLPIYKVSQTNNSWYLSSHKSEILKFNNRISKWVIMGGFITLISLISFYLILTFLAGANVGKYERSALKKRLDDEGLQYQQLLSSVDSTSQLPLVLYRIQYISSNVIKAGGWINQYDVKSGSESFQLILPEWISKDYLEPYGANFKTQLTSDGVLLNSQNYSVFKP
jgi:hypothetical protein